MAHETTLRATPPSLQEGMRHVCTFVLCDGAFKPPELHVHNDNLGIGDSISFLSKKLVVIVKYL